MSRPLHRMVVVAVAAVSAVALSACTGGGNQAATSPVSTGRPRPAPSSTPDRIPECTRPDPSFDFGQCIHITAAGFEPSWLVSLCCGKVTWTNMTGKTVEVVFDHQAVDSGKIAPGGTFVWKPSNVQSVTYHDAVEPSLRGTIQVNQSFES